MPKLLTSQEKHELVYIPAALIHPTVAIASHQLRKLVEKITA